MIIHWEQTRRVNEKLIKDSDIKMYEMGEKFVVL
jgi:hypothetical protein